MAKRLSADEWAAARGAWEADPSMTMGKLADAVGISKQSVHGRMKKDEAAGDPWAKRQTMADIAAQASKVADRDNRIVLVPEIAAPPPGPDEPDPGVSLKKTEGQAPLGLPDPVSQRAEVISRHRREWGIVRGLFGEAVKSRDFEKAKLAKIGSETMSIMHKGERTAWGLDSLDPDDKPPVVIIERTGAEVKK
jgi:hypothetical protein